MRYANSILSNLSNNLAASFIKPSNTLWIKGHQSLQVIQKSTTNIWKNFIKIVFVSKFR